MKPDCCPEPLAGPVVGERTLVYTHTSLGPLAIGAWPHRMSLHHQERHVTLTALNDILAGLYLAVDYQGRLRWLGKARRNGGVAQRLREHLAHPERDRVFAHVYVFEANPDSLPAALACAEGMAADLLELRGHLGARTWPTATGWNQLVATAA
ncbi:hypothetical protein [Kitasatospora purpeofusca]|uniref:hypothetical protein n=1 Tax=Kitasatospora purpeofusca TaxID=67352 RepID=UPI0022519F81|nr:hypothetical protein [Kitasatospora purpeofusca]WSR46074.1 hypothetical protein OG196_44040 [Kitasatospora purpeofusca]